MSVGIQRDITGQKFNRLTVIGLSEYKDGRHYMWDCVCDCGTKTKVRAYGLTSGKIKSCGCLQLEVLKQTMTKHGRYLSPENQTWRMMKQRCYNPKIPEYKNYGGRGIIVCDRWLDSFENFYEDMGERPSKKHSIDRIDNNKNYEPSNCKWSVRRDQDRNRTDNSWVEYNGEKMIYADWAKRIGIKANVFGYHIKKRTIPEIIKFFNNN